MSAPRIELLSGDLHGDGWASGGLALRVEPEVFDRVLKIAVRNPHLGAMHLRNQVRIDVEGERLFDEVMFPGVTITIERPVDAKAELLVELSSEAVMAPDALDSRERGVFVKLTQTAVEAAKK